MKNICCIFAVFVFIGISFSQSSPAQPSAIGETENKVLKLIPITEITSRADQTIVSLSKIQSDAEPRRSIMTIEEKLPKMVDSLQTLRSNPRLEQLTELNVQNLQNLNQEWSLYFKLLESWQETLQGRSQDLEKEVSDLRVMAETWKITSENAIEVKAPQAIRERVKSIQNEINTVEKKVSSRLNQILVLQSQISQEQIKINDLLSKIRISEQEIRDQLFVVDSPPLWESFDTEEDSLKFTSQFEASWKELFRSNVAFLSVNEQRFYIHLAVYVILIILMVYLNHRNKQDNLFNEEDDTLKASAYFVSRPYSAALLISLILSVWIYPESTSVLRDLILLLLLIPVIRFIPGMLPVEIHKSVYLLYGLFVLDILQKNSMGFILFQRLLLLIVIIIVLATLSWLMRPKSPIRIATDKYWMVLLRRAIPVIILLLIVAFIGNLIGSSSLAKTITWGIIDSGYILITLIIASMVVTGLVTVLIRQRRKRASQFVKTYALKIERWANITINLIAFLIWVRTTLNAFGFLRPFYEWFDEALTYTWEVGTIKISVNAIFDFLIILIFTFIIVRIIRIILDLEVFPRIKLPRGIPGAISMVVRYIFVATGILVAISSLGIDLGSFGLLAGALGVGLGFGLQNIIANFVSGLILAFERPIQVGDTVQVDTVVGNVQSIGVRSSTVRTFDGSEVIVPNADLISHRVTNWTLSDRRRRMELPVKVAFGNDPHQVLDLILMVAKEHQDVLDYPEPFSVFNGFGDNYLDFALYFWIPTHLFFKVKTEVALGVHDVIKSKGIDTPRPQRDIRMTTFDNRTTKERITPKTTKRKRPGK